MAVNAPAITRSSDHIPALDGLRGIAVLLVFFFHVRIDAIYLTLLLHRSRADDITLKVWSAGWCGVDLFFVLSGFLITRILLEAKSGPRYFRVFYARRALRIFPLYYLFLVYLILLPHWRDAAYVDSYKGIPRYQEWFFSYLSNFPLALSNVIHTPRFPATHLWTLAIEEQFYLVWPLVVLLCGRRSLMAVCGTLVALALALRIVATLDASSGWATPFTPYYFTPMKVDTLAIGALIACVIADDRALRIARRCAPIAGLVALVVLVVVGIRHAGLPPQSAEVSTVGFSALAVLFGATVLMVATMRPEHVAARLLSGDTITAIGRYSYAIYLFHPLVLGELRSRIAEKGPLPDASGVFLPAMLAFGLIGLATSFGFAWLSWRLIEAPILSLKRFFRYSPAPGPGFANPDSSVLQVRTQDSSPTRG